MGLGAFLSFESSWHETAHFWSSKLCLPGRQMASLHGQKCDRDHPSWLLEQPCPCAREHPWSLVMGETSMANNGWSWKHKKRASVQRCVPRDPLSPQEYEAPEPEQLLLYPTVLLAPFSFNLASQFCNPMQTFSIGNVLRKEFHRLTTRKNPDGQREVPGCEGIDCLSLLSYLVSRFLQNLDGNCLDRICLA